VGGGGGGGWVAVGGGLLVVGRVGGGGGGLVEKGIYMVEKGIYICIYMCVGAAPERGWRGRILVAGYCRSACKKRNRSHT